MDWAKAVERNSELLKPIIATLFAMLGLTDGAIAGRISRPLHNAVLRILRPAEAAVRRLIVIAAKGLKVKAPPHRPKPAGKIPKKKGKDKVRKPIFQLEDSRPPMMPSGRRGKYRRRGPRIFSFWPTEPTIAAIWAARAVGPDPRPPVPPADGLIDGSRLSLRLQAIKEALADLPKQARRLARWRARRERIAAKRHIYTSPLRPGRLSRLLPEKPRHEVEDILRECQWLAWEAAKPDTS